ncbi:hypothetical protein ACTWP5_09395 [Streptomyces sp. 4N509B]|uniref:hypothetical protein n=1 Tax=Streptomyces sp. 4N509B TaxID=3457413 RepID=UPI003FCF8546
MRLRLRLGVVAALVAACAMVLAACGGDGGGRRGGGTSGGGGDSSVDKDDDHDHDDDVDVPDVGGGSGSGGGGEDEASADASPHDQDTVDAILPDDAALARTILTNAAGPVAHETSLCEDYAEVCANAERQAQIAYGNEAGDQGALFGVLAYPTPADARAALDEFEAIFEADDAYRAPTGANTYGDDSIAYEVAEGDTLDAQVTLIAQGPYLGGLSHGGVDAAALGDRALIHALSDMLTGRMAQAVAGQTPTVAAERP